MLSLCTVIKPIYGAASIGVVRVNDVQQLETAYKRVTRELAKAHIVAGALQQGEDEDEDEAADEAIEATVSQVCFQCISAVQLWCTYHFLFVLIYLSFGVKGLKWLRIMQMLVQR